jgi:hypothetical protein
MTTFDEETISRLRDLREVSIRTAKRPDAPVTIWVVTLDGEVYVRSFRAAKGRWFKDLAQGGDATLEISGTRVLVRAIPSVDGNSIERVSAEYLRKYGASPYAQAMVQTDTLPTTLRLEPR